MVDWNERELTQARKTLRNMIDRLGRQIAADHAQGATPILGTPAADRLKEYDALRLAIRRLDQDSMYSRIADATGVDRAAVKKIAHALGYGG